MKLLPCPFCGEQPSYIEYPPDNTDDERHFIECDCGATMGDFTKEKVYQSWNTRVNETGRIIEKDRNSKP